MRYDAERGGREWAREWARERERERLWTVRSHIHVLNGITHGPLHTRPECRNLRSTSEGWRRQRSTLYLNGNERDFWKIVKKSGMDVRSWNFFYVKIQPSSKCEKISASYVHFWFFYNFSKIGTEIFFTFRRGLYLDVKKISAPYVHSWYFYNFKDRVHSHLNTRWSVASSAFAHRPKISTFVRLSGGTQTTHSLKAG